MGQPQPCHCGQVIWVSAPILPPMHDHDACPADACDVTSSLGTKRSSGHVVNVRGVLAGMSGKCNLSGRRNGQGPLFYTKWFDCTVGLHIVGEPSKDISTQVLDMIWATAGRTDKTKKSRGKEVSPHNRER